MLSVMTRLGSVSLLLASQFASAGGLWLNEYGSPAMGRARAGAQAGVSDASAIIHNPATMSRVEQKQMMAAGTLIYSRVEFDLERSLAGVNGNDPGGDAGSIAPGASLFYVNPNFRDKWSWGFSVAGLAGSALDYSDGWAGRYQATSVELITVAFMTGLSYQVNDWLSVGIGPELVFAKLSMEMDVPRVGPDSSAEIDGDDTRFGYLMGAAIELTERTRIGIVYQSELEFDFSGDLKLEQLGLDVGVETNLPLAAYAKIGITHQLTDAIGLHATYGWEDWDALDKVNLSTNSGGAAVSTNWKDTHHYAVGIDYQLSHQWRLSTGVSYDTSPVSKYDRNAQLPADRQVRYAFGAEYQYRNDLTLGGQIVHGDLGDSAVEGIGFGGDYKNNDVWFVSFNANWRL